VEDLQYASVTFGDDDGCGFDEKPMGSFRLAAGPSCRGDGECRHGTDPHRNSPAGRQRFEDLALDPAVGARHERVDGSARVAVPVEPAGEAAGLTDVGVSRVKVDAIEAGCVWR